MQKERRGDTKRIRRRRRRPDAIVDKNGAVICGGGGGGRGEDNVDRVLVLFFQVRFVFTRPIIITI